MSLPVSVCRCVCLILIKLLLDVSLNIVQDGPLSQLTPGNSKIALNYHFTDIVLKLGAVVIERQSSDTLLELQVV